MIPVLGGWPKLRAMAPTRALGSALVGSTMSGLGGQLALLASGVISARMLGPEDRGHLALLILIPIALAQIGHLGLPLAVTYEFSRDERTGRAAFRNVAGLAAGIVLVLVVAHAAIVAVLVSGQEADLVVAAVVTLLIIPAESAQLYGLAILQGRRDFIPFNVLRLLPAVAYGLLAIASFLMDTGSLPLFALWFTGSYASVAAVTLVVALRRSSAAAAAEGPRSTSMLRFGLRGLIGAVSPIETLRLDQAIVGLFLSPAALGIYVVGAAFTNLPRFIAQGIGMVAYPHVTFKQEPSEAHRSMWRFVMLALVACLAIVVPLEIMAGWLVPAFFGEAFTPAATIMRILLVSSVFLGVRRVLTDASRGLGKPGLGTVAELVSWVSLVPLIAVLAPRWGVAGVAWAFTSAAAIGLVCLVVRVLLGRPARANLANENMA